MAADNFLKIDGIEGESKDSKHPKEIEVPSYSWGVSNSGTMATGTVVARARPTWGTSPS